MSRPESELSVPTKLRIIEEADAEGETAAAYQYCRDTMGRQDVPGDFESRFAAIGAIVGQSCPN